MAVNPGVIALTGQADVMILQVALVQHPCLNFPQIGRVGVLSSGGLEVGLLS